MDCRDRRRVGSSGRRRHHEDAFQPRRGDIQFRLPRRTAYKRQVYYGKLDGLGSTFPVLTDVFYVQTGIAPATKASTSVLLKRGREWHAPDQMVLNSRHIVLVEPVTAHSKVAELIAKAK